MTRVLLPIMVLASVVWGQLPDAPSPQTSGDRARRSVVEEHEFFDKTNIAGIVGMVGLRAADTAISCNYMATYENFRDVTSPFRTCAGVMFFLSSVTLASYAGMQAAHDAHHHRIERVIPWVSIGLSAGAIGWNLYDSRHGLKCRRQFGCG
jgi:hypothetical protein